MIEGIRGWSRVPIIVLSVRDAEADKVAALDAGRRRLRDEAVRHGRAARASARRAAPCRARRRGGGDVETPDFTIDLAAKRVDAATATEVRLTPTEWHLVEVLVRNRGQAGRAAPAAAGGLGPEYDDETNYLRVFMAQVRRKLEPEPSQPRYFITEPGMGYRFELPPPPH